MSDESLLKAVKRGERPELDVSIPEQREQLQRVLRLGTEHGCQMRISAVAEHNRVQVWIEDE